MPFVLPALVLPFLVLGQGDSPCVSGLRDGQRCGPYSFLVATGPQRGQPTCYVCETADRPAVIIFARELSDPLGKLVQKVDKAVFDHKKLEMRSWVTFLHEDQLSYDPKVVSWGQKFAVRNVPLGVYTDAEGPPSYRLSREADVTVLFMLKQKVVANYAFRSGELSNEKVDTILQAMPRIVVEK